MTRSRASCQFLQEARAQFNSCDHLKVQVMATRLWVVAHPRHSNRRRASESQIIRQATRKKEVGEPSAGGLAGEATITSLTPPRLHLLSLSLCALYSSDMHACEIAYRRCRCCSITLPVWRRRRSAD